MYSVIRFLNINDSQIYDIVKGVNYIIPGFWNDIERNTRCDGYSFDLVKKDDWYDHYNELLEILTKIVPVISPGNIYDWMLEIDLAVYVKGDCDRFITEISLPPELIQVLFENRICFTMSIYNSTVFQLDCPCPESLESDSNPETDIEN